MRNVIFTVVMVNAVSSWGYHPITVKKEKTTYSPERYIPQGEDTRIFYTKNRQKVRDGKKYQGMLRHNLDTKRNRNCGENEKRSHDRVLALKRRKSEHWFH